MPTTAEVIASVFQPGGHGQPGDFAWMIDRPEYADSLFVFNDNAQEFAAHRGHPPGSRRCRAGGGNAVIRPYQCHPVVRASGIPTGSAGQGFAELSPPVRALIDEAIGNIERITGECGYRRVFFSATPSGDLGTGIFRVGGDVKSYVLRRLRSLDQASGTEQM